MNKQTQTLHTFLFFMFYHFKAFWRFLWLGNWAWNFWGVKFWSRNFWGFWFLPPFNHPCHLKSRAPTSSPLGIALGTPFKHLVHTTTFYWPKIKTLSHFLSKTSHNNLISIYSHMFLAKQRLYLQGVLAITLEDPYAK